MIVAVLTAATLSLAGCGGGAQPAAAPSSATGPFTAPRVPQPADTSDGASPGDGVPQVADPIDTTTFQKNLCSSLTVDQLKQLGVGAQGQSGTGSNGPECDWVGAASAGPVGLVATLVIGQYGSGGLGDVYGQKNNFKYFEPTTMAGYPAVYGDDVDGRSVGKCVVSVGVVSNAYLQIDVNVQSTSANYQHPCDVAKTAATAMISTMKAGG